MQFSRWVPINTFLCGLHWKSLNSKPFVQGKCSSWLVCLACFSLCLDKKQVSIHANHLLAIDKDASCLYEAVVEDFF